MEDLLFLAHRIPYPPEKGEKIRAWHMLLELARTHRIHLGCLVDDPDDLRHLPALAAHCADLCAVAVNPRRQRLRALLRARPGRPLSLDYFDHPALRRFVAAKRDAGISRGFVYCSAMAPYLMAAGLTQAGRMRLVLDMVDVDSAKWAAYAATAGWPARAVWAREARTLLAFERRAAAAFDHTLFVSAAERATFAALAPETAGKLGVRDNGVDLSRFAPGLDFADPYPPGLPVAVFTGSMDYRPNIAAVTWFARAVLPRLAGRLRLAIVGANPAPAVRLLAALPGVIVTGRVADTRPWIAHAALAVAPLGIARGIQNKVLEAMAMGRPVVATPQAFEGIDAVAGRDLLVAAAAPEAFAAAVAAVLDGAHRGLGAAARAAVERRYAWSATLGGLGALFEPASLNSSVLHEVMI